MKKNILVLQIVIALCLVSCATTTTISSNNKEVKSTFITKFDFINESAYKIIDIKAFATNKEISNTQNLSELPQDFFSSDEQCILTYTSGIESKEIKGSIQYNIHSKLVCFFIEMECNGDTILKRLVGAVIYSENMQTSSASNKIEPLPYIGLNTFIFSNDSKTVKIEKEVDRMAFPKQTVLTTEYSWRLEVHNKTPDTFDIVFANKPEMTYKINGFENVYVPNKFNYTINKNSPIAFTIRHNEMTFFLSTKVMFDNQIIPIIIEGFGNDGKIYYTLGQ